MVLANDSAASGDEGRQGFGEGEAGPLLLVNAEDDAGLALTPALLHVHADDWRVHDQLP
jgi:hypothetical protein